MAPPLNPAQKQAVEHQIGPLLVLAGAGSGKTRVITHRIARLLERGIPAQAIIALTFTNKAAGEMRERVLAIAPHARALTISTFHAFGLSVLQREKTAIGGAFTIFDQGDALGTVKEALRSIREDRSYDAGAILTRISNAKNAFQRPEDLTEGKDEYDAITHLVYPRYVSMLRQYRAYDFDDLVCEVARLFTDRADVLARWQDRFTYLLVDEYQDTNRAQLELLRLLASRHRNVCVVGDDDQSIYAWRGADVRNILDFEQHFPGATVIKLEQNYRSRAPILGVANAVIARSMEGTGEGAALKLGRYKKVLFTDRAGGERVRVRVAPTPEIEAAWVAREVKRCIRDAGRKAKDIAILYRSNGQAKLLEEALREESVAHRVVGGQQFFERKEVKDVLGYMKVALNPHDEISLRRVVNYPARGIGETSLDRIALHAVARGWSLWQAVERVDALDDVPNAAREGCRALERVVLETKRQLDGGKPASEVARELCERSGLKADIESNSGSPQVAARRWSNIESLLRTFGRREAKEKVSDLGMFLHALTLDFGSDDDVPKDAVTLSTLHGSKGLEFEVVFLVGCEEGLLPHTRTLDTRATDAAPQDIEEERRLFYVGVTRAREELTLTRAKHRATRGKLAARTPSRFLLEVPEELVDIQDVKAAPPVDAASLEQHANAFLAALDGL